MFRSILPFILASLGFILVLLAINMPLLEWKIDDVSTDFPSNYQIDAPSSPVKVKLGEALERYHRITITKDKSICRHTNFDLVITRSLTDETLEQISLTIDDITRSWGLGWYFIGIILFIVYIWVFTILYKYPLFEAFGYTLVVTFVSVFLMTQIVRNLAPRIVPINFGTTECDAGIITITASLAKIHFEVILIYIIGTLLELGAFGEMFSQITKAISIRRKTKTSK